MAHSVSELCKPLRHNNVVTHEEDEMLDSITNSMNMNLSKLQAIVRDREACYAIVHGVAESNTI